MASVSDMDVRRSDLIESYRLDTEFYTDHVTHIKHSSRSRRMVEEEWARHEVLGQGSFSLVHKQMEKQTGRVRAVKTITKSKLPPALNCTRELLILALLAKHKSLFVEFQGWFENAENLYIAMEYFALGDLRKNLGKPLPEEVVKRVAKQLLEGLEVMHAKGIAHRDLKPENIFVVSMSPVWVKLGDFGISKRVLPHLNTSLHTQVSTRLYAAPEVLGLDDSETSNYSNAVDIWSLGCVLYELLVGVMLFTKEIEVMRYYIGKWTLPVQTLSKAPLPSSDLGISLINDLVALAPQDRPSAEKAMGHEWLGELGDESGDDRFEDNENKSKIGNDLRKVSQKDKDETKFNPFREPVAIHGSTSHQKRKFPWDDAPFRPFEDSVAALVTPAPRLLSQRRPPYSRDDASTLSHHTPSLWETFPGHQLPPSIQRGFEPLPQPPGAAVGPFDSYSHYLGFDPPVNPTAGTSSATYFVTSTTSSLPPLRSPFRPLPQPPGPAVGSPGSYQRYLGFDSPVDSSAGTFSATYPVTSTAPTEDSALGRTEPDPTLHGLSVRDRHPTRLSVPLVPNPEFSIIDNINSTRVTNPGSPVPNPMASVIDNINSTRVTNPGSLVPNPVFSVIDNINSTRVPNPGSLVPAVASVINNINSTRVTNPGSPVPNPMASVINTINSTSHKPGI